jgi:hypothetical protein
MITNLKMTLNITTMKLKKRGKLARKIMKRKLNLSLIMLLPSDRTIIRKKLRLETKLKKLMRKLRMKERTMTKNTKMMKKLS